MRSARTAAGKRLRARLTGASLAAAVMPLALVVGGCGAREAGSAAIVGNTSISEASLQSRVQAFIDSLPKGQQANAATNTAQIQTSILNEMVVENVVGQVADSLGIAVSPAQVSSAVAATVQGEGANLDTDLVQYNLTPATLPNVVHVSLLYTAIGQHLGGASLAAQAAQTKAFAYVETRARELPVTLNPRYGTWNPADLTLSGGPRSLSTPAA